MILYILYIDCPKICENDREQSSLVLEYTQSIYRFVTCVMKHKYIKLVYIKDTRLTFFRCIIHWHLNAYHTSKC